MWPSHAIWEFANACGDDVTMVVTFNQRPADDDISLCFFFACHFSHSDKKLFSRAAPGDTPTLLAGRHRDG